jgi:tocopherol O-methyltransferase
MLIPDAPTYAAAVARHYGELDAFYRELWGDHLHHGLWRSGRESIEEATTALAELAIGALRMRPGSAIVDVGCGYGGVSRMLAARGASVTALSVTPEQVEYALARRRAGEATRYMVCDWLHNPLPDEAFDGLVAIESTEHMIDRQRCMSEMARVLRPGGRAVICAWLSSSSPGPLERRLLLEPICSEGRLAWMGNTSDYAALLGDAGFETERFADLTPNVVRTWSVCVRRLASAIIGDSRYRRALLDRTLANRVFALTVLRIRLAYGVGAMRYGMFVARKP